jgi:hypothetical protein
MRIALWAIFLWFIVSPLAWVQEQQKQDSILQRLERLEKELQQVKQELKTHTHPIPTPRGNTVLLLHFDGDWKDECGKSVTTYREPILTQDSSKFGTASAYFKMLREPKDSDGGDGNFISVPNSDDWNFGTGKFTIDCWVKCQQANPDFYICGQNARSSHQNLNTWEFHYSEGKFSLAHCRGFGDWKILEASYNFTDPTLWNHIACTRDSSGYVRFFVNGTQIGNPQLFQENMPNIKNPINFPFCIGGIDTRGISGVHCSFSKPFYLDELRICKDYCAWISDFTVPNAKYCIEKK